MRSPAGLQAQQRGTVSGRAVPIGEEFVGAAVEEDEAGEVDGTSGPVEEVGMEGPSEPVGGEGVETSVLRDRGRAGHRVEYPLHARANVLLGGAGTAPRARLGGMGEVVKVGALCLIEAQGAG